MESPRQDDDLLYHYCSMESFVSILKHKQIWFGNLNSMNDPSEMFLKEYNFPRILLAEYSKKQFPFEQDFNGCKNNMQEYLLPSQMEHAIMQGGKHTNSLFAFCLSEIGNDLSQWRLYADNGRGVCLGFRKSEIEKFIGQEKEFQLQRVEYFDSPEEIVMKIAQVILEKIKSMYDAKMNLELNEYRIGYLHDLVNEWSKYKVKDYSSERETRIVCRKVTSVISNINALQLTEKDKEIEIRLRGNDLVTYVPVDLFTLGLESVALGPINHNNKDTINLLLAKHNIDIKAINIYKSTIPYRG